jgi:hypothetical protein
MSAEKTAIAPWLGGYDKWRSTRQRYKHVSSRLVDLIGKSASSPVSEISRPTVDRSFPIGPIYVKRVTQVAFDLATQLSLTIWTRVQPMVGAKCR